MELPFVLRYLDVILLGLYAVTSTMGLLTVKASFSALQARGDAWAAEWQPLLQLAGGAALYISSFLIWMVVLSRLPLSVAYPISIGLTLSFSVLGAMSLLGEPLMPLRIFGIVLIFVGIVCVTWQMDT